ncbi:MAG: chromate transporter [Bacteroidota bacterium]
MKLLKYKSFLKDVFVLAFTSFGGPQVHFALYLNKLVKQKKYLTEAELLEIQALCSFLPGPTSTQMITAIGFKLGGPLLAYLTLVLWIAPAVLIMTLAAFGMTYLRNRDIIRYIQPVGIAFLIFAGFSIGKAVLKTKLDFVLMAFSAVLAFLIQSPWICPIVLLVGGVASSLNYKAFPKQPKHKMIIPWANFNLFWIFLVFLALLGHFTDYLPIRLFENFYRNGSLVFGGGQVLAPILYTEFVNFKQLIRPDDFLTGMALSQATPGPVFAFTSYIGVLALKGQGFWSQILGSIVGAAGIFLPGTFLIFFVFRIWKQLKQYRGVRASLQGVNASTTGLTLAAAVTFVIPIIQQGDYWALFALGASLSMLFFTKIPSYIIFLLGLAFGFV